MKLTAGAAALLCAVAIAALSLGPPSDNAAALGSDKTGHLIAYFVLTGLLLMAHRPVYWPRAALMALGYGGLMELGQMALPFGREASWLDMAANATGVAVAFVVAGLIARGSGR